MQKDDATKEFSLRELPATFRSLPRVLRLVWDASPQLVTGMAFIAGESIALVGQNGAGKTTLVKLLTRLYDPTEGEILVGGRTIKEYDPSELRGQIGVIFQDYVQYHLPAHENIGIGRVAEIENRPLVELAARKSGADAVIARLDEGYDAMLGRWFNKGVDLSGG